jgi:CO/xanthine dehydrogenase Mo-binding subunit
MTGPYTGRRVARIEDRRLLTGAGQFTADVRLPDLLEAVVLRSPHAHARIRRIDTAAAAAHPEVALVLTGRVGASCAPRSRHELRVPSGAELRRCRGRARGGTDRDP